MSADRKTDWSKVRPNGEKKKLRSMTGRLILMFALGMNADRHLQMGNQLEALIWVFVAVLVVLSVRKEIRGTWAGRGLIPVHTRRPSVERKM